MASKTANKKSRLLSGRWLGRNSLKKRNYVFALLVGYSIPVIAAFLHSLIMLWGGTNLYQVENPLGTSQQRLTDMFAGALTCVILIPFLQYRLLRWLVAIILCGVWYYFNHLGVARQK